MLTESTVNPFAKRESHSKQQLLVYKVLTILTWILVVIVSVTCSFKSEDRRTIWGQNKAHPTPFSLNPFITDIYWRVESHSLAAEGNRTNLFTQGHLIYLPSRLHLASILRKPFLVQRSRERRQSLHLQQHLPCRFRDIVGLWQLLDC